MFKRGMVGIVAVVLMVVAGVVPGPAAGAAPGSPSRAPDPAATEPTDASDEAAAAAVSTETFTAGPFDLAPAGQPGDQVNRLFADMPRPEGDLAIRGITWRLVDATGNPADPHMVHLHHIVLLDTSRRDQLCSFPSASRFAGTGMELTPVQFPEGYAYHSEADAPWQGVYHVMNMGSMPAEVSIEYTVEWSEPGDLLDVEPYFFDVTGCWGDSTFDVPGDGGPGSVYEKTNEYTMTREGRFVAAGAHLHEGGIDLALTGPGDEVCRAAVHYHGTPPHMGGIEPCGPLDEEFAPGDRYTLTARYQNHEPVPDAMGIMISYLHHTDPDPPMPEVDVEFLSLDAQGLRVSLTCANADVVYLDASVSQTKSWTTVDAWGSLQPACTPVPTVLTLPLEGVGTITGGTAQVYMWASASNGQQWADDSASGEYRVSGRLDLVPFIPADGGPNPITIEGQVRQVDGVLTVRGVVHCDEAVELWLDASGWQKAGLGAVDFYGGTITSCDGDTSFAIPVSATRGRLAGGQAQVIVYAYDFEGNEGSVASRSVQLMGSPLPAPRPPAPDSPLQVRSVQATADGTVVTLTLDGCPAGARALTQVSVEQTSPRGVRAPLPSFWSFAEATCVGGQTTIDVLFDSRLRHRVLVEATGFVEDPANPTPSWFSTWAELPVTR